MAHKIAMIGCPNFATSELTLYVVFVNAQGGLGSFVQTSDGVWYAPGPETAQPPVPPLPNGVTFSSILGPLSALPTLIALGNDGHLYCATFYGGAWSQFAPFTNPDDLEFSDFSAGYVSLVGLVVVGLAISGGFFAQFGSPGDMTMSAPALIPGSQGSTSPAVGNISTDGYGISVVLGVTGNSNNPLFAMTGTFDGNTMTWTQANVASVDFMNPTPTSVLVTPGNPNQTLQAILLQEGLPALVFDDSGSGSNWVTFGFLPGNPQVFVPSCSSVAAGIGNAGNLQLVGLVGYGVGLPILIWQDTAGKWFPDQPNPPGQGLSLPTGPPNPVLIDLAIGMGGQDFLQVGYLAEDGESVFINWQDTGGHWNWYAGLGGSGLP